MFWQSDEHSIRKACAVCELCPVKDECLEDAIVMKDKGVVRGGRYFG